ncbi:MAG: MarR family transcriptional regulator [Chloroflexi bacterium]|nr:MarR family transcriptional regulator [Chloroflexota bacterium]
MESMTEPTLVRQTMQLAAVWDDLVRLKPRLKAVLPEDLARLKDRLGAIQPEGGARRAADYDLFYRIGVVLARQQEPLTMGQLSEALAVPLSTATRMVDWLVESSYVERLADPEDRRIVRVALTEAGRELYQAIHAFMQQRLEQLLRQFTAEEREQLIVLLRKLIGILDAWAR